jgi:hypothetical protein
MRGIAGRLARAARALGLGAATDDAHCQCPDGGVRFVWGGEVVAVCPRCGKPPKLTVRFVWEAMARDVSDEELLADVRALGDAGDLCQDEAGRYTGIGERGDAAARVLNRIAELNRERDGEDND